MRTARDLDNHKDLVIAISWNQKEKTTHALVLGCDERDLKSVNNFMRYAKQSSGHPLLLLTVFIDLELKRFKTLWRTAASNDELAIDEAGLSRDQGEEVFAVRRRDTGAETPTVDYDKITRDVLMNFQDSAYLLQAMIRFRSQIEKVITAVDDFGKCLPSKDERLIQGLKITQQLTTILGRYDNLIEQTRLTTGESSLLMSAIWNLIAQKDNKINQAIAQESKNIAMDSKNIAEDSKKVAEDSKTIAEQSKALGENSFALGEETKVLAENSVLLAEDSKYIAQKTKEDSTAMTAISWLAMVFLPLSFAAVRLHLYSIFHIKLLLAAAHVINGNHRLSLQCPCSTGNLNLENSGFEQRTSSCIWHSPCH
jgi:hypothetical protein